TKLTVSVVSATNQRLLCGEQSTTDEAAMGDAVVAWVLVKGGGKDSIRENPHTGGAQHGSAELLAKGSGIVTVLGIGQKELFIARGVEGGKQGDGAGNLGDGKHQFVDGVEGIRSLFRLNYLGIFSRRGVRSQGHLLGSRLKLLGRWLSLRRIGQSCQHRRSFGPRLRETRAGQDQGNQEKKVIRLRG